MEGEMKIIVSRMKEIIPRVRRAHISRRGGGGDIIERAPSHDFELHAAGPICICDSRWRLS
jgi:hypothetical protein